MEAQIKKVEFHKERNTKYGLLYVHKVYYDDKYAFYSSKRKDQRNFVEGEKAEFTEEKMHGDYGPYYIIKPISNRTNSNFGKALKREQSKYSGFSDSYIKDMLVAGVIRPENTESDAEHNDIVMITWKKRALEIFEHMVELDKSIQS